MGRRLRVATGFTLTGLCVVGGILLGLHLALQRTPDFYQEAVAMPVSAQKAAGKEFERNVLALHNDLQQSGQWTRVFSADEINGWLAVELPAKFPKLLPPTIHDPRVELAPQQLLVAFRYEGPRLNAVVSLTLEVQLADEPNTLAVRVRQAQAGWVPIPLNDFLDQLSEAARRADLNLRWASQDNGDPVALIKIPSDEEDEDQDEMKNAAKRCTLTAIEIRTDELVLSGRTGGSEKEGKDALTTASQSSAAGAQSATK